MTSSPKYKHLGLKPKQSPIELKEKMRKNYKNKIQNCRGMLMDKFRGPVTQTVLQNTLTDIYKSMFKSYEDFDEEEIEFIDELKNELVQEELDWWIKEYENCQMLNVDWSTIEESNDVICPVCQKSNLRIIDSILNCTCCNITIPTERPLVDIKNCIFNLVDNHSSMCNSDVQFVHITEVHESHIYLMCESCMDMKLVI